MDRLNLFEKIKNFKHKEIAFIVIIIVLIIAVLPFAIGTKSTHVIDTTAMSAKDKLTYEIKEAVSAISGDDDCKVVIVWEKISEKANEESTLGSLFSSANSEDSGSRVGGVAIVCKNGNDAKIKVDVTMMLSKILGVSVDKISVNGKK